MVAGAGDAGRPEAENWIDGRAFRMLAKASSENSQNRRIKFAEAVECSLQRRS
jgi:hypothetical protein